MAIIRTEAEIEVELEEVRARRRELRLIPASQATGRNSYSNAALYAELRQAEAELIDELRAAKIASGRIRPATRVVV